MTGPGQDEEEYWGSDDDAPLTGLQRLMQALANRGRIGRVDVTATRDDLADAFGSLKFSRGAEIGVERGQFSRSLLRRNKQLSLMCVDAWAPYQGYREHVPAATLEAFLGEARARLAPYGDRGTIIRAFSQDAAREVEDHSLDFVYIDAAHDLPSVIADLAAWTPKVRKGGIVSGHDYRKSKVGPSHVPQAIQAWTNAYGIEPWFVLTGDRAPSWCWVVQ